MGSSSDFAKLHHGICLERISKILLNLIHLLIPSYEHPGKSHRYEPGRDTDRVATTCRVGPLIAPNQPRMTDRVDMQLRGNLQRNYPPPLTNRPVCDIARSSQWTKTSAS